MSDQVEFFSKLNTTVHGSVKFGDTSVVEIKGVGSILFIAKMGGNRLLTRFGTLSLASSNWMRAVHAWRSKLECFASGIINRDGA
jgi:hypothetical protein